MITGIDNLLKLKILDLSHNKLTSIDALKGCIQLETLSLQNNQIRELKGIERISPSLLNLQVLYLQDLNGQNPNPCCLSGKNSAPNYRSDIIKMFNNRLLSLDGQRTSLPSSFDP